MNIQSNSIRLLTFNILRDYGIGKPNSWQLRRESIFSLLRFHAPDLFCLQEPLQDQVEDLKYNFIDYDCYSVGCKDGEHEGEHLAIFYLKKKFVVLSCGRFGLSEEPKKMGVVGWDAKNPRLAIWLKLLHINKKQPLYVVTTHLDHVGENARQQSALLIVEKMHEISCDVPVLLCGDFNANPDSQTYKNIIDYGYIDCSKVPNIISYDLPYTYHKFLPNNGFSEINMYKDDKRIFKIIDHIFYKGNIQVLRHGILNDNYMGAYPSDHLPKVCDILLDSTRGFEQTT